MAIIAAYSLPLDGLQPAYQPLPFTAQAVGTPPVVYCDVYFNGIYYKTLSSYSPASISGGTSLWTFDVQGLAQEYIQSFIPDITATSIQEVFHAYSALYGQVLCYCSFRSSSADSYGIITPEGPEPVQATIDNAAVSGGGYASDTVIVVNAALQWSTDVSDISTSLQGYRHADIAIGSIGPSSGVYPLTHMVRSKVYTNDHAQLPLVVANNGLNGYSACTAKSLLTLFKADGTVLAAFYSGTFTLNHKTIFLLPTGVPELTAIYGGAGYIPSLYLPQTAWYKIHLYDQTHLYGLYTSPAIYIQNTKKMQPAAHTRIWFQNYLGQLDQLNFIQREEFLKVSSTPTERFNGVNPQNTRRQARALGRNNVRGIEISEVTDLFEEQDLPLLKELAASSNAYLEIANPDYYSTPASILLPIVIQDIDIVTHRFEDRYEYQTTLKYHMSNEIRVVRQ